MEFTAKEIRDKLRPEYLCYAHFYAIQGIYCRRQLEVIKKESTSSINDDLTTRTPNATIIMANPGSAAPEDSTQIADFKEQVDFLSYSFDATKLLQVNDELDQTLWRVKELMDLKNWTHVRVINLSDLRAGNDRTYIVMRGRFHKMSGWDENLHSMFSCSRQKELDELLRINGTAPILFAWGIKNAAQSEFADKCLNRLKTVSGQVLGVIKGGSKNKYYHPLAPGWVSNLK